MKYRKKPVVIDAEPYKKGLENGFTCPEDRSCPVIEQCETEEGCRGCSYGVPYISTLEGKHIINPTDMIITGVKGERYPCKKDIFELTYEKVE